MAWKCTNKILVGLAESVDVVTQPANRNQAVFSLNRQLGDQALDSYWILLQGITIWFLWIARNDTVFNHDAWPDQKVEKSIWNALVNYGTAAWLINAADHLFFKSTFWPSLIPAGANLIKVCSHMVLRVLLEGVLRTNPDEVLDWIHFANTTSSAKWEHTLSCVKEKE